MTRRLLKQFEEENNYEEIIKLIDKLILKNPENAPSLLFKKAEALIELKKYDQAINVLKIYAKDVSNDEKIEAYILIAICYWSLDDEEKHEKYLSKVLELDSENVMALKNLSYDMFRTGNYDGCCKYIKKLIEINKADIEDYTNLIFSLIELDKIDEALTYAKQIMEIDPTNLDIFVTLTIMYESLEDEVKLKEVCNQIMNLKDDGTQQIILLKAQASLELGYKKEAFEYADKAIKLNPYDPFPYLMKGLLFNKLDMEEEAIECFDEALQLNPEVVLSMLKFKEE